MSDDKPFSDPKLAINRVYTRHGDGGKTRLVGGQKLEKDDARIEAYGTVDELNAFVGVARQSAVDAAADPAVSGAGRAGLASLAASLHRVQHELFNLGSILATLPEDVHARQPRVTEAEVLLLESEMDACQTALSELRSFVLPGGARLNAELHVARTVCRRAERRAVTLAAHADVDDKATDPHSRSVDPLAVTYLNRLSDAFFVWSRWASVLLGAPEVLWEPNRAASALAGRND